MQHKIVHGKNNLYSDLYLIILMIALELCWWWLLIEHSLCPCRHLYIPLCPSTFPLLLFHCVPVVICVPVSQSVISLWVSWSSFIFPVSRCPGRHFCPGRHLCSGVPVCNFSLSVQVVVHIPCVPVVICVPELCWWWLLIEHSLCTGHFLFECPGRHLYSLCPGRRLCPDVPVCNFVN